MDQAKFYETAGSWASIGGIVGFVITFLLFGIGGSSGAIGILLGALKGFVGGGIGAAIFYCLAGVIFSPKVTAKMGSLAVVIVLSLVALFLVGKYSEKFRSFVDPYGDTYNPAKAEGDSNTTIEREK